MFDGFRQRWQAARTQARLSAVSKRARRKHLTYLTPEKLASLERCVERVEREGVGGDFIECGVALGGSALVMCSLMGAGRRFVGYDLFGMIPAPGDLDDDKSHQRYQAIASGRSHGLGGETYYGYRDDLYDAVVSMLSDHGVFVDGKRVTLERGLFEDTLHPDRPVALVHIDCDWHDPVALCLQRLEPWLAPGAILISDDYHDYGGCRRAVDAFLARRPDFSVVHDVGHLVIRGGSG